MTRPRLGSPESIACAVAQGLAHNLGTPINVQKVCPRCGRRGVVFQERPPGMPATRFERAAREGKLWLDGFVNVVWEGPPKARIRIALDGTWWRPAPDAPSDEDWGVEPGYLVHEDFGCGHDA